MKTLRSLAGHLVCKRSVSQPASALRKAFDVLGLQERRSQQSQEADLALTGSATSLDLGANFYVSPEPPFSKQKLEKNLGPPWTGEDHQRGRGRGSSNASW